MATDQSQISDRERDILRLVATGATNQQIAQQLNISVNTVKVHLRNIFGKIGAASRTEATMYAVRIGLVALEQGRGVPPDAADSAVALDTVAPAPTVVLDAPEQEVALDVPPADLVAPVVADPPQAEPLPDASTPAEAVTPGPQPSALPPAQPSGLRRQALVFGLAAVSVILLAALVVTQMRQGQNTPANPPASAPITQEVDRWTVSTARLAARSGFAVAAYDGRLYVIGGSDGSTPSAIIERYDPGTNNAVRLNDKPTAVSQIRAVSIGGEIYVPGGEDADGNVLSIFEAYDPSRQQWEALPPLPDPRSRYGLARVAGRLYLFGGWDGSECRPEVFAFDPERAAWEQRTPLQTPRCDAGIAVVDDRVAFVIGGENAGSAVRTNERYDPGSRDNDQISSAAPLPEAIAAPAVAAVLNNVLVFDAESRTGYQYDPTSDSWVTLTVRDDVALSSRAEALNTSVFVFGPTGSDTDAQPLTVSEYRVLYSTFLPNMEVGQ